MNDAPKPTDLIGRIRNILIWVGAVIVVLTDLFSYFELHRIEELLHK